MPSEKANDFRTSLLEWSEENVRRFPWRNSERSLYDVFIAELFLTQTPAENVASVYPRFLERFPSLDIIDESSNQDLIEVIEPLGFYNIRAEALKSIAAEYESLPESPEGLGELPRVGPYVSNATLCFARNLPLPILDRNAERIYQRVFGDKWPDNPDEQIKFAERLVPEENPRTYNLALLDFGAAICRPNPLCKECFAIEYCYYHRDNVSQN